MKTTSHIQCSSTGDHVVRSAAVQFGTLSLASCIAMRFLACAVLASNSLAPPQAAFAAENKPLEPMVVNSEKPGLEPISPTESLKRMTAPEGFRVSLFAGEPDVRQPIAMNVDDRGRLWVAECYSYPKWSETGFDRLVIYSDPKHTGQFEKRTVFWDKGNYLTGFALGHGGVYVCCAPRLLFIPDRDGDDVPDGPPETLLDGWSTKGVHNVLNSLAFGPDGWLYGCNGITAPSLVGKPGAKDSERVEINCGIWRYHPIRKEFEAVVHGTTNPWGLDWNDYGEAFFTNCVIGHLWHLIPGGHYQRMFGSDVNPNSYTLLPSCSDHLHWVGGDWTKARGGKGAQDKPGGGHAHSGCLIDLSGAWPDKYRNSLFTCNIHGNRLNNDLLGRQGCGYVGKHSNDFLMANDDWFRGVALTAGPDGAVYVADWCDTGECHDLDTHRTSGRIYKVAFAAASPRPLADLAKSSDLELVQLQLEKNDWYVRHARRLLQERSAAGKLGSEAAPALVAMLKGQADVTRQLRALWALHNIGKADESLLLDQLSHSHEAMRSWAIRLLCESKAPSQAARDRLATLAAEDKSGLVRLTLASTLQRVPAAQRWPVLQALCQHEEDAQDKDQPLMIWYAVEPLVEGDKAHALALAGKSKIPLVRQNIARRAAMK